MGRKEQQEKIEDMAVLIENVRSQLRRCSDCLNELEWAGHVERLDKLQQASVKLNEKLSTAAPFAAEPVPGFNDMCEKLRSYVIKEYIAVARLTHKKFLSFSAGLEGYEAEAKAAGYQFDMAATKEKLAEMTQAFRRLGSKKVYQQGNDSIEAAVMQCERVRAQAEELLFQTHQQLKEMLPA